MAKQLFQMYSIGKSNIRIQTEVDSLQSNILMQNNNRVFILKRLSLTRVDSGKDDDHARWQAEIEFAPGNGMYEVVDSLGGPLDVPAALHLTTPEDLVVSSTLSSGDELSRMSTHDTKPPATVADSIREMEDDMPPIPKGKNWYESRTIMVNLIVFLVTVLAAGQTLIQDTSIVTEHPTLVTVLASSVSILNLILRKITTQPLK